MSTSRRSASFQSQNNGHSTTRRSPRRLRTKTPSVNDLSRKLKVSPKGKRKLEFQNQKEKVQPLKGKRFYLDLHNYRKTAKLCEDIKQLGGTVEEFLSKDVTFVITDSKEVDQKCSPRSQSTPSPGMFNPSPSLLNKSADSPQNAEQQTVKKHTRGQAFVNRSLSQTLTHKLGSGNVLSNARLWDVTIVRLEKLLEGLSRYLKPGKTTSVKTLPISNQSLSNKSLVVKVRKLQVPFIKVEDHSRQYKPLVHELKEWPKAWFDSPPGWCPFDHPQHVEDKEEKAGRKQLRKDSTKIKENTQESKKKKRGYCECCCLRYEDLDQHLKSENHKTFAKNSNNYSSLDQLIARGSSLEDLLSEVQKKNATPQTPERSKRDVLPESTTPQTPVNCEYAVSGDEKIIPRTRAQLRACTNGSPKTNSETLETENRKGKKEITEQSGASDLPTRRTRSSNAMTPPEKQSLEGIDHNESDHKSNHDCKTPEESKSNTNSSTSRSSKKGKSISSDGVSSKENYDPSPKNTMQTSDSLEQEAKNSSTTEVNESNVSESNECKNFDKQHPKPVAGEKNGVEKEDNIDDSHSDCEPADEVRLLCQVPQTQTLRGKSFLKKTKKKKSTKSRNLETQKKQKDATSSVVGVKTELGSLNKVTLQTASVIKDKKCSNSRRSTTQKHNCIELSSDKTESIYVPSSIDSLQNSSQENTPSKESSASTITLPREDSLSESNEATQLQFRVRDPVRKSTRKRLTASYKKDRSNTKCTVSDRNKKSVSVNEHSLQKKQKIHKKTKENKSNLCPEVVMPVFEKGVGAIPETHLQPSAVADEAKDYELTSSPSSGYSQRVGAAQRKVVKKKVATVDDADETLLDTDVSLIAQDGNDTVTTTRNHYAPHVQIEAEVSERQQNEQSLSTLFPSDEDKEDKFMGFIKTKTLDSTKNILPLAKKDKIETIARTQVDDGQSRSDGSLEPQQVPTFELSEFDEVIDDEQESFSVCINSIVDSIQVDTKNRVPETVLRPREKETSKCVSGKKIFKLQKLLLRKQGVEFSLKDKSQADPNSEDDEEDDCDSIVSDSTGEESDSESIEPFITPIRLHKRKSVDLSDDEITFKFPTKRRRTLNSTSSVENWSEEPSSPTENEKSLETAEFNYEEEQPKPVQISSNTSETEVESNACSSQKSYFQSLTNSEFFDFSKLDDFSFYVDITERVKLRRRKRLLSVEKSSEENTVRFKQKSTLSLQEQPRQKARKTRSSSLVEKSSTSETLHPKSKRHLRKQNLEEKQQKTHKRERLASVPVRSLTCQLNPLSGTDLRECTSPPRLSPITSTPQKVMVSTPGVKASIKKRLRSTPCSARYPRRNLRSIS